MKQLEKNIIVSCGEDGRVCFWDMGFLSNFYPSDDLYIDLKPILVYKLNTKNSNITNI